MRKVMRKLINKGPKMGRSAAEAWPGVEGGGGEVTPPPIYRRLVLRDIFNAPNPVSKETVRRIESASRTPPHSCCEEFCLTEAVFERIGFEVSLRSFFSKCENKSKNAFQNLVDFH